MELSPLSAAGRQVIHSYGDGGFRVSGRRHDGSILVFPTGTLAWSIIAAETISIDCLAQMSAAMPRVEILLLGTGRRILTVPPEVLRHYRDAGFAIDVMDTGAACRTFNLLAAEDRRVAAALIAVD
ncbi:MAG TPA: hypothetical protein HPQ04_07150 [Rhodospirillaceae bacterium]|nr:hypothetical protein [Rhodospirillaceae bacterium]